MENYIITLQCNPSHVHPHQHSSSFSVPLQLQMDNILAVHQKFAAQTNAVRCASATRPHQHFSHFRMPHLACIQMWMRL